jgi:hypothetical protein
VTCTLERCGSVEAGKLYTITLILVNGRRGNKTLLISDGVMDTKVHGKTGEMKKDFMDRLEMALGLGYKVVRADEEVKFWMEIMK